MGGLQLGLALLNVTDMFQKRSFFKQFQYLLLQVFLVGMAAGSVRTVLPVIAESEYHLMNNSLVLITALVVAFGLFKALSNIIAGLVSDTIGRKKVLLTGWILGIPAPVILLFSDSWSGVVICLIFLGINQGLTWSMTQSAKMDIVQHNRRGQAMGLNEFSGYLGVAVAGVATAYMAELFEPRFSLFLFMLLMVMLGLVLAMTTIHDVTLIDKFENGAGESSNQLTKAVGNAGGQTMLAKIYYVSWHNKSLMALCQAGLVEKFVDSLIWIFYPIYLFQNGLTLPEIGWVVGCYGVVWGGGQLFSGWISDHVGRWLPIVSGMFICAFGVILNLFNDGLVWWSMCSVITGGGMALLYPNLSAAVADLASSEMRSSALGIYRFWRDLGYMIAAILFGLTAVIFNDITSSFVLVFAAMCLSALILIIYLDVAPNRRLA